MTRTAPRPFARALGALALGPVLAGKALTGTVLMGKVLAGAVLASVVLAGATLLAPAPGIGPLAATPAAAAELSTCQVTGGTLDWGVKERFRAYISSTIANGEWEASDGASYETPSFTFSGATGEVDAETGEGSVSFDGTVVFTGHDGVLNLTLANPTIEFAADGSGRLLLDTRSNNADGELVVDESQASVGRIAALSGIAPSETAREVVIADADVALTAEGAEAFAGFYPTGEALDPLNLTLEVGPCAGTAGAGDPGAGDEGSGDAGTDGTPEATAEPEAGEPQAGSDIPWLPIGLGGAALVLIAIAGTLLVTGRKKPTA